MTSQQKGRTTTTINDGENDMTYSRRAVRYLSQFGWYYPAAISDKEGRPSLDAAWAHYEHVTLARHFVSTSKNSSLEQSDFVRAPQSQRLLRTTQLYSVWETPLQELVHFGVSIRMFFSTLLVLSAILGLAGLLNLPLMLYFWGYADGDSDKHGVDYMGIGKMIRASALCDSSEWVECETCHASDNIDEYPAYRLDTSSGQYMVRRNICDFDGFLQPGLCSFAATILILVLTGVAFFGKQRQAEIVFDEEVQTASDYSIKVSNPPPDALDAEEWRKFFNQYACGGDDNIGSYSFDGKHEGTGGVAMVTIALDNAQLLKALIQRRQKLQALSKLLPHGMDMSNLALIEEGVQDAIVASSSLTERTISFLSNLVMIQDARQLWNGIQVLEDEIRSLAQQDFHSVAVFVTFETERSQRNALHALSTGKMNIWRNQLNRYRSNLQKGGRLTVQESTRSSSLWDCHEAVQEQRTIQLMTSASTDSCSRALLFRGQHVLNVKEGVEPSDVRWVDLQASHRQRFELYAASTVGMMMFLMCSGYFIYRLAENYPGYYAAIFIAITNTIVPIVCELINDLESHPTEHGKQISLYVKMTLFRWFNSAIALSVISTFIETISVEDGNEAMQQSLIYKVYPVIVAELFCNPIIEIMDVPENFRKHFLAPRAHDQEEMNGCFTGGNFWLAERYTNANKVLFVALFFSSILPEALFLGSMALLAQFFVGKFCLLRLCGPSPDIGFHLSRLSRNYFTPIVLVTHVVMNAYWWSGYPYDNVCENDEQSGGGYSYCNQNFYGSGVFPPLPRFQPEGAKWMTEGQKTLSSLYGWTSVVVIMVTSYAFLCNSIIPSVRAIYESTYEPDGMDQGINFSSVKHREELHGYIPQVRVKGFLFPLLACDTSTMDEDLIDWKDKHRGYIPHSLVTDVHTITGSNILHPIFSIVKQWNANLSS